MTLKALVSAATVALLSLVLSGCVSDSYYYDGYRDYGPAYGRYESSAVIYRTGPRYRSQHYRSGRYYRDDRPRRDRREARSPNRPREAERNTRGRDRPEYKRPEVNRSTEPGNPILNEYRSRIIQRNR